MRTANLLRGPYPEAVPRKSSPGELQRDMERQREPTRLLRAGDSGPGSFANCPLYNHYNHCNHCNHYNLYNHSNHCTHDNQHLTKPSDTSIVPRNKITQDQVL